MPWTECRRALLPLRAAVRSGCLSVLLLLALPLPAAAWPFWMQKATSYLLFTPLFLGPDEFEGGFSARTGASLVGLQATYSGTVVVTNTDRAVVQQMLPAGMSLASPKPLTFGSGKHPVIYMIGEQRSPSTFSPLGVFPAGPPDGYKEMILLVPFVTRGGGSNWQNLIVRMYLSSDIAVFGGNEVYGYQKVKGRLDKAESQGGANWAVLLENPSTLMFRADLPPADPSETGSPTAAPPRWADVEKILSMPFFGTSPDGIQLCSYWELTFGGNSITPTTSKHQVFRKFRDGMEPWETMGPLAEAVGGAFVMNGVRWRLGAPWLASAQGC
jgi:hypothetical protein